MCKKCYGSYFVYGSCGYYSTTPCIAGSPGHYTLPGCEAHQLGLKWRIDVAAGIKSADNLVWPDDYGPAEIRHARQGLKGRPL